MQRMSARSGLWAILFLVLLVGGGGRLASLRSSAARADAGWTLLPQVEWWDSFSPLYTNGSDGLLEGDPNDVPPTSPSTFTYNVTDPDTGDEATLIAVQNEALINFRPTITESSISSLLSSLHLNILGAWYEPNVVDPDAHMSWFHVEITTASTYYGNVSGLVAYLNVQTDVEAAEPNAMFDSLAFPPDANDTFFTDGTQREMPLLNAPTAWQTEYGQTNTTGVAVMDSGVDVDNEDLVNKIYTKPGETAPRAIQSGRKTVIVGKISDNPSALKAIFNSDAHGTLVAGIVGAETNNGKGVAGCAPSAQILPVAIYMPVPNEYSWGALVRAVKTLRKVFTGADYPNLRVVNMSFGGIGANSTSFKKAIKKDLKYNDRLYVGAAGQNGKEGKAYPAAYPFVLGVTAAVNNQSTQNVDAKTSGPNWFDGGGTNSTPVLDVYGISGYYIWGKTTDIHGTAGWNTTGDYSGFGGTSGAAPQISALAALLYSKRKTRTYVTVDGMIKKYTKGGDYSTLTFTDGQGRTKRIPAVVDFDRAVQAND